MTATVLDAPTQDTRPPTLEMRGISKTFPGIKALNNVQLKAWGGEIQSLMGENGAGKIDPDEDPVRAPIRPIPAARS